MLKDPSPIVRLNSPKKKEDSLINFIIVSTIMSFASHLELLKKELGMVVNESKTEIMWIQKTSPR